MKKYKDLRKKLQKEEDEWGSKKKPKVDPYKRKPFNTKDYLNLLEYEDEDVDDDNFE